MASCYRRIDHHWHLVLVHGPVQRTACAVRPRYDPGAPKGLLDLSGGSNTAFPVMVRELLPAGIKGVVLGGAIAALMSSLASLFNSSATLFTVDFYERLRPDRTQRHYLRVGRIATTVVVLLGIHR